MERSTINREEAADWLDTVKSGPLFARAMDNFRSLYARMRKEGNQMKDIRDTLLATADHYMEHGRGVVSDLWNVFKPDILMTVIQGWEDLAQLSMAKANFIIIAMHMYNWIEEKCAEETVSVKSQKSPGKVSDEVKLKDELMPLFYNNEPVVLDYLTRIKDATMPQITSVTKDFILQRKLSELSARRNLWTILTNYGLYTRSESNWDNQLSK